MKAYDKIPEWKEIIFKEPALEEENTKHNLMYIIGNLPEYNEDVIVTDGIDVWIDAFDEAISGEVYLSGTGGNIDEVTAWMPLPTPYKWE
ncbi:hypothetical protein [Mogibacterium diversum]